MGLTTSQSQPSLAGALTAERYLLGMPRCRGCDKPFYMANHQAVEERQLGYPPALVLQYRGALYCRHCRNADEAALYRTRWQSS